MKPLDIVLLVVSAVAAVFGWFYGKRVKKKIKAAESSDEKLKKQKKLGFALSLVGSWLFTVQLLGVLFGQEKKGEFDVALSPEKWNLFGHSISSTIIITWVIMTALIIFALIVRVFFIPKFTDKPKGLQNVLELMVESIAKYTDSTVPGIGLNLGAYVFTLASFMVCCAFVELFGIRSPTSDLTLTAAMAIMTFVLINYYGIKRRGVAGRIKTIASPSALILPIRIICDCAVPVSMACRLFGNMLGGIIVIDLLYYALGNKAVGIPSVLGLYFNVFHPLIQAFIFVTLTLTFINEAVETVE